MTFTRSIFALILLSWALLAHGQVRFWAVTGTVKDVDMYRRIAADFSRDTGIRVEVTPLAWGNFETKYFAAMAAGLPPDVGITNLGGPFNYGSVGGIVDLRAEFPVETKELEKRFNPQLLGIFTAGNKLFGIPADLATLVLFYRTDIFARLGLKAPKTWSELNRVIAKLEASGYKYYFGFTNGAQWALGIYTLPFDKPGFRMGADGEPEVLWNDPQYQRGIMEALNLWNMHDSPGRDLGNRAVGMFRSNELGEAAPLLIELHTIGGQISQNAPELEGKWDTAPWPRADDGTAVNVMGGTAYVIFRQSKKKHEAMQWIMYLNSPEVQRQIMLDRASRGEESSLAISPFRELWDNPSDPLWRGKALEPYKRMREVVAEVFPAFRTVPTIQGSTEASRLESNLLDQMSTFIRDRMDALARKHNISRSELVKRFGSGALAEDRARLEKDTAEHLRAEYAKIQPEAQAILRRENARYEERYGAIVRDLPKYERQTSVLDVVKYIVGGLLVLAVLVIAISPKLRQHRVSYLFVATPLVLAIVFVFVPALTALYLSFTDYHPVLPLSTARWVGGENYQNAMQSGDLTSSLGRTVRYAIYTVPIGIIIALVFAYMLSGKLRGQRFWRFLYFSPLVTSVVSIALIFSQLFLGGKQGWLNAFLLWIGAIRDPIPFLTSEHTFLNCVIILAIWHGLAFTVLVFLAGLQQIPETLFEAAAIDGASQTRRFWNIAIPGLRPQMFFITVLGLIGAFQVFETIYVLAGKSGDAQARFGANDSALTMVPLIYHTGFETFEMGKSAAFAYILFVMILILTGAQFAFYRRSEVRE